MPSGKESATSRATRIARRVLPTPPGPMAVTRRCSARAEARAAASVSRPTKEVSGVGSDAVARRTGLSTPCTERNPSAACASSRRSATWSLRSNDETWLSTVRTEM